MANQMRFPPENKDEPMKESMQAQRGSGSRTQGLTICAGVCWAVNLNRKSSVRINGNSPNRNSTGVVVTLSLAISANITAKNIRQMMTKAATNQMRYLAALFCSKLTLRFSASLRCFRKVLNISKIVISNLSSQINDFCGRIVFCVESK